MVREQNDDEDDLETEAAAGMFRGLEKRSALGEDDIPDDLNEAKALIRALGDPLDGARELLENAAASAATIDQAKLSPEVRRQLLREIHAVDQDLAELREAERERDAG